MSALESETENDKLSLESLVKVLDAELNKGCFKDNPDIFSAVTKAMSNFDATNPEWEEYAYWKEGQYTRNLIATDNKTYTLMLLCWNKGAFSPIHDHGGAECWARVVKGTVTERMYAPLDKDAAAEHHKIEQKFEKTRPAGAVCFIDDGIGLHALGNASLDEVAVSLHCYSPPFESCHAFCDEEDAAKQRVCPMLFHTRYGITENKEFRVGCTAAELESSTPEAEEQSRS
eukprot:240864_1